MSRPAPADLQQFIALLEGRRELARIAPETDPLLEIAAVTNRVCKSEHGGPALLFERPGQSSFSVATNLFGSLGRICLALGMEDPSQLTRRMQALLQPLPTHGVTEGLDHMIAALPGFTRHAPLLREEARFELVEMQPPDLTAFPFLQAWPGDGAVDGHPRYITLPMVFTAAPDGGNPNCGMYRAQVRGERELALQCKPGSGAARHLEQFRRLARPMPVAIALGGAPALTLSAMLPLPGELDEVTFAGLLAGTNFELHSCRTVPLRVPTGCEVVIEGYLDPAETVCEGPFGNHTGGYAPASPAPLLRVSAISHRPKAVIPATVVGPPPMEDCWMGKAWERLLLPLLQRVIPAVRGICFPLQWIFHQSAVVAFDQTAGLTARQLVDQLWQTPWFSVSRLLILVDGEVDVADLPGLAWTCINRADFSRDLLYDRTGRRMALDARGSTWPLQPLSPDPLIERLVGQRWREYGID